MVDRSEDVQIWVHHEDANRIHAEWTRPDGGGGEPHGDPPSPDVWVTSRDATDLPNRVALETHLARNTGRVPRGAEVEAVLVVELDDFEDITDLYGEDAAFDVMVVVAERLTELRGASAFHLGDNVFVVVTGRLRSRFDALAVARRVQRRIAQPFAFDGCDVGLSASIGIRVALTGARDPAELVLDAAFAVDVAKRRGRGESVLYTEELRDRYRRRES